MFSANTMCFLLRVGVCYDLVFVNQFCLCLSVFPLSLVVRLSQQDPRLPVRRYWRSPDWGLYITAGIPKESGRSLALLPTSFAVPASVFAFDCCSKTVALLR